MKHTMKKPALLMAMCLLLSMGTSALAAERNSNFLTPEELARLNSGQPISSYQSPGIGNSPTSGRNNNFLTPEEIAKLGSTPISGNVMGGRDKNFLTPEEAAKVQTQLKNTTKNVRGTIGSAKIANCKEWVNVRAEASTKSKSVGKAYLGDTVNILYWNTAATWAYANYGGSKTGWISGQFLVR